MTVKLLSYRDFQNKSIGKKSEGVACKWLLGKGFKIQAKNYRTRFGEVDIIALKNQVLYLVEVKTKRLSEADKCGEFGLGVQSVNKKKLMKIVKCGENFSLENGLRDTDMCILVIEVNWYNQSRNFIRMVIVEP